MKDSKYSKYIITDVNPNLADSSHREARDESGLGPEKLPTHVMWLDNKIIPGAFYAEAVWV
jgi:quercetin dioxygenase-like cupin family protein